VRRRLVACRKTRTNGSRNWVSLLSWRCNFGKGRQLRDRRQNDYP
jgi:hypothetical protein